MKMYDIVNSLITDENLKTTKNDVFKIVEMLVSENICDRPTLYKIGKMINDMIEYEKAPV